MIEALSPKRNFGFLLYLFAAVLFLSRPGLADQSRSFLKCFDNPAACEQPALEASRKDSERAARLAKNKRLKASELHANDIAIIIGNRDYLGLIPDVDFAHNDADAVTKYVETELGFSAAHILDLREATSAKLEALFGNHRTHEGRLWRDIDPEGKSNVLVFYSGHGVPGLKDRRGYLLPVDADPEAPEMNGYPLDTLLTNLGKLNTQSVTVFLDACFSGESQKGMLIRSVSGISVAPKMPTQPLSGVTVITAARADQIASWDETNKHGLFTLHLLDALYGGADQEGVGNQDGNITLREVQLYLDRHMTNAARKQFGRRQNVWVKGQGEQVLVKLEKTK